MTCYTWHIPATVLRGEQAMPALLHTSTKTITLTVISILGGPVALFANFFDLLYWIFAQELFVTISHMSYTTV